mmetsp:Transcript_16748/g.36740  ORF Transcript_16748/g.36740 Transcript_16748/m.36740 type:complete len:573 (-) Transcript_16748:84-1802(-)
MGSAARAIYIAVSLCGGYVPAQGAASELRQPTVFMAPADPHRQLRVALQEALGVGHGVPEDQMRQIKAQLAPTWKSLPKTPEGNLDRRSLCYVVYRFFKQAYGIVITGLDPEAAFRNEAELELFGGFAPDYVRNVLQGETAQDGFSIEDGVAMIVMVEHLISDSSRDVLEEVYARRGIIDDLDGEDFTDAMQEYFGIWMLATDPKAKERVAKNLADLRLYFDDWLSIANLVAGAVRTFEQQRDRDVHERNGLSLGLSLGSRLMERSFSFDDAQAMATDLTKGFSALWDTTCQAVTEKLAKLDSGNTGRVPISTFYKASLAGEWHFSESLQYLQEQGIIDNSSSWHGPRVIIPNYVQAASNCIAWQEHFSLCCPSQCEGYMDVLEQAVGAPSATAQQLFALVDELLTEGSDEASPLPQTMRAQLVSIADGNDGQVPLHGRLFAQWLHYVFPYDCPFPHMLGAAKRMTPFEFGASAIASKAEMGRTYRKFEDHENANVTLAEDWMTLWHHEEELVAENLYLASPWQRSRSKALKFACIVILALVSTFGARHGLASFQSKESSPTTTQDPKCHVI